MLVPLLRLRQACNHPQAGTHGVRGLIKGGAATLGALDTSVYSKERHAAAWVAAFGAAAAERQVELLAELFMHLPQDEQRMVVGSLA